MVREITGITWDHSRALPPLVAASQRYEELHPGVSIKWEKRTLHEFGHMPIERLADRFDLIVIDHPWAAYCFQRGLVHNLLEILTDDVLEPLRTHSIGPSYHSYDYEGHLLALPVDAATPVPSWRPDLMESRRLAVPSTWSELVALADAGHAVMPGFTADLFLNWCMLLAALKAHPFGRPDFMADEAPAIEAMNMLRRLAEAMPRDIYTWNPIAIAETMTRTDAIAYCAFAYSYNNYARSTFSPHPLCFGNLVALDSGTPLCSVLGGTGLAIGTRCHHLELAADFCLFCTNAPLQQGIYALAGGQPARMEAWDDPCLDTLCGHFFSSTRRAHEQAILRPRYDGYVPLQEQAGAVLQQYLQGVVSQAAAWERINQHYRASRAGNHPTYAS